MSILFIENVEELLHQWVVLLLLFVHNAADLDEFSLTTAFGGKHHRRENGKQEEIDD